MIYIMKRAFTVLSLMIFGGMLVYNCEPEPDSLGEQLFLDGAANGNEVAYDLVAYNIDNKDTVRTDAQKLGAATLGAFSEGQFGMQKASYYTQLRLPAYDPDFGTNAEVDSVVLVIKPTYATDSLKTTTDENYMDGGTIAAKKVVNTYPVTKYGKAKLNGGKLTVKVNEVMDFMNGYNDIVYSNQTYAPGQELGSKTFDGDVKSVVITKDSDNSSIFSSDVGFRIPLSASFFKTKIIDKKGQPELKDVSNFIRHFRGLKISVAESDGYLFQFSPSTVQLIMYYKNDKLENGVNTRPQTTYSFSLGNGNVHVANYAYNRIGSGVEGAPGNPAGNKKLFAQGMGGNSIGIKFDPTTIADMKSLYQTKKAAIISAKIRMYTDKTTWDNKYKKPTVLTIVQRDLDLTKPIAEQVTTAFTQDMLLSGTPNFAYIKAYDLDKNPAYYEFTVTQSLKDIVESGKDYTNKYFKIDLGSFLPTSTGALAGYNYTSRAFATDRAVFVGSDPTNPNNDPSNPYEIKLRVTYVTK